MTSVVARREIGGIKEQAYGVEYRGVWEIGKDSTFVPVSFRTQLTGTQEVMTFESSKFADGQLSLILEIDPTVVEDRQNEDAPRQVTITMVANQHPTGISQGAYWCGWALDGYWIAEFKIRHPNSFVVEVLEGDLNSDCYSSDQPAGGAEARLCSIAELARYCSEDGSLAIEYKISSSDQDIPTLEETYDSTGHLLFDNPQFCDVAFKVESSYILAVKDLLIQRSSYFRTLFESGFSESSNVVDVDPHQLLKDYPPPPREEYDDDDMTPFEDSHTRSSRSTSHKEGEPECDEDRPAKRVKRGIDNSSSQQPTSSTSRARPMLVVTVPETCYYTYRALIGYLHSRLLPFTASPSHYHAFNPEMFELDQLDRERLRGEACDRAAWLKHKYDKIRDYTPPKNLWPASPHAIYRLADRYDLDEIKVLAKFRIMWDLEKWTAAFELFSPLSLAFPDIQDAVLQYVCDHFREVKESEAFRKLLEKIHSGELANAKELTGRLFSAVLHMQP